MDDLQQHEGTGHASEAVVLVGVLQAVDDGLHQCQHAFVHRLVKSLQEIYINIKYSLKF